VRGLDTGERGYRTVEGVRCVVARVGRGREGGRDRRSEVSSVQRLLFQESRDEEGEDEMGIQSRKRKCRTLIRGRKKASVEERRSWLKNRRGERTTEELVFVSCSFPRSLRWKGRRGARRLIAFDD